MEASSAVTLKALRSLAERLYRWRAVSLTTALAAAGWFVLIVARPATDTALALLALSLLLWSVLALGMGLTLVRLPPEPSSSDRWYRRLRKRALRGGYWVLAIGFVGLAGLASLMTLRALRLMLG